MRSSPNRREDKLLSLLNKKSDYIPAKLLSEQLNVSEKTIYRLVKAINRKYSDCFSQELLIISSRGNGYKLNYAKYIEIKANKSVGNIFSTNKDKRKSQILIELLLNSPNYLNLDRLYENYFVSESVRYSEIREIEEELTLYNISCKKSKGFISLEGSEENLRRALSKYFPVFYDINQSTLDQVSISDSIRHDIKFVKKQLEMVEKQLNADIPYPYDINFFSHLLILLNRSQNSRFDLKKGYEKEKLCIHSESDDKLMILARKIWINCQNYLGIELNTNEINYIFQYLNSSRIEYKDISNHSINKGSEVAIITDELIDQIEKKVNILVNFDLRNNIYNHTRPMLNRIKNGIFVKNTFLNEIKHEYSDIFYNVNTALNVILTQHNLPMVSEDEVGFITLYFANAEEILKSRLNIIIVCTTGIGTSTLIKTKVEKNFPDINILKLSSSSKVEQEIRESDESIDLIVSTVLLNINTTIPILIVSALFSDRDQYRLKEIMGRIGRTYDKCEFDRN